MLVLHDGALGDCALAIHVVAALRRAYGVDSITIAARSSLVCWAEKHGLIEKAFSLDQIGVSALYEPAARIPATLCALLQQADCVVSFLGGPTEEVSTRLSSICHGRVLPINPKPTDRTLHCGVHITTQWADDLGNYGRKVTIDATGHSGPRPALSSTSRPQLRARLEAGSRRIALCHPGSGSLSKCCPLPVLERLLTTLQRDDWAVAWMVGPDEMDRFGRPYMKRLGRVAPVLFDESVDVAADWVCGADAFIGNDAGMTHVAALAGVPTLALFGPTDPRVWRPLGPACRTLPFPREGETTAWLNAARDALGVLDTARVSTDGHGEGEPRGDKRSRHSAAYSA